MNSSRTDTQDLSKLIGQAQAEVDAQAKAIADRAARQDQPKRRPTLIIWILAILVWAWQLWPTGPSELELTDELSFLMAAARADVEAVIEKEGRLPDRLQAHFFYGTAVRYEPLDSQSKPPTYRLNGTLAGQTMQWSNMGEEVAK